jgi:protein SCO1/2
MVTVVLLAILVAMPALIASGALGQVAGSQLYGAFKYDPPVPAPDFRLLDADGRPLALEDLRGKYALIYFGYTFCPDVCPDTLLSLARIRGELGERASQVKLVFVTVDPERDTPEVIGRYVRRFAPDLIGLTGDPATIAQVARSFGVRYNKVSYGRAGNYAVDHSAYIFLVDRGGRLLYRFDYREGWQELSRTLQALIQ